MSPDRLALQARSHLLTWVNSHGLGIYTGMQTTYLWDLADPSKEQHFYTLEGAIQHVERMFGSRPEPVAEAETGPQFKEYEAVRRIIEAAGGRA